MCGISGFTWSDESLIKKMNHVNRFRGPDDQGFFISDDVTLGHTRLSILDLSDAGHQPMAVEDESLWITYNGEIYNFEDVRNELVSLGYKFKSNCDTEVLLQAYKEWGMKCFDKFNGMWALALYDKLSKKLFLVRDRFGIKPLFYTVTSDDRLIFSSMISALFCHNITAQPNDKIIMQYLAYNLSHHSGDTFFSGVSSLLPGSYLEYDLSSSSYSVQCWYNPENNSCTEESENEIFELFEDAVNARTVADVPIGSCLSGGIDSSAIVCLLNKKLANVFNTYSLVLNGHKLDEAEYIKEVGQHTNTSQYFTTLNEESFLNDIDDFIEAQEEPVPGLSVYAQYRVMKCAGEQGAKVLLDGQGGDEVFAGYIYYFAYRYFEVLKKGKLLSLVSELFSYTVNFKNFMPQSMFLFLMLPKWFKSLCHKKIINTWTNYSFMNQVCKDVFDPRWNRIGLDEALKLTLEVTAIPHLLRWEDKNSMRWSIESRVPFLDYKLVERVKNIHSSEKIKNGKTKIIFKNAIKELIPELIYSRKDKIGFGTDVNDFFRKSNVVDYCKKIIYSDSFKRRPYWDWGKVKRIYENYLLGKNSKGELVMKWICMELWLQKYFGESQ